MKKKYWLKILTYSALVFFILYRSFFVFIMWKDRAVPPEPDDSYSYIYEVRKVFESKKLISSQPGSVKANSLSYFIFNLILSIIAWLTSLPLEQVFHFNFYLGTIFMGLTLLYFLKKFIKKESLLLPLGLLFFALYNGSGYYHGFYWVVPSFYCFLFFLLLFGQIFNTKRNWHFLALFLSFLFIASHPIAGYAVFIFPAFFIFYWALKRKFDSKIFKRVFLISLFCCLSFLFFNYLLPEIINVSNKNLMSSPQRLVTEIERADEIIIDGEVLTIRTRFFKIPLFAFPIIWQEYFKVLFPYPFFFFIFLLGIFILIKEKKFKILSLYFSCLSFVLISTIHPYGYRSLLFLWPITFLLLGFFVFYTFDVIKKLPFSLGKFLIILITTAFVFLVSFYNFHWAKVMNKRKNISWNRSCADFLLKKMDQEDLVLFGSKLTRAAFFSQGLITRESVFIETFNYYHKDLEKFPIKFLVLEKDSNLNEILPQDKEAFLLKKCGYFNIYKIKNEN